MASLFKGMSQTNFLDGLVEKTGLNGHELCDYIMGLLEEHPVKRVEEKKENEAFFPHGEYTFTGSLSELRELYLQHGGKEEVAKFFGSCVPGLAAIHVAAALQKERFEWVRPVKLVHKDGVIVEAWRKYSCWFIPETGKYDFDDGQIVKI